MGTTQLFTLTNSTIVRSMFELAATARQLPWRALPQIAAHQAAIAAMRTASAVAPRWALKHAVETFVTPPRFMHSAAERRLMEASTAMTLTTPMGKIAAWRIGPARAPVVLISHGWGGRGAQLRAFIEPLLAAGYQVTYFDHIGHGMSDQHQATLVDMWKGIEAVWDALADRGLVVEGMIAHSLGGAAVASALRRNLSRKQVNVTASPKPRVVLIAPPSSLIRYSRLFARYIGIPERIRDAMQWRFEQRTGVAWSEFELPHSVDSINAPALFIHDADDRETRLQGSVALASAWPDARFMATQGLGHRRILRDKRVIAAAIDFIGDRVHFARPPASPYTSSDSVAPLY